MPKDKYTCQLCQNHGLFDVPKKGHKQNCPYKACTCSRCILNTRRRELDQKERLLRKDSTEGDGTASSTGPPGSPSEAPAPLTFPSPPLPAPPSAHAPSGASPASAQPPRPHRLPRPTASRPQPYQRPLPGPPRPQAAPPLPLLFNPFFQQLHASLFLRGLPPNVVVGQALAGASPGRSPEASPSPQAASEGSSGALLTPSHASIFRSAELLAKNERD